MAKTITTALELTKMIQARVSASTTLDGDCQDCELDSVYLREPDNTGDSNWDLKLFTLSGSCSQECSQAILAIVAEFKPDWNLLPE